MAENVTGMEPQDSADGEAGGTEPDTGANVDQQGDFQGNY